MACWGYATGPAVPNGPLSNTNVATTVEGLNDALAVSTGGQHSCAVRATGELVCWGRNGDYGEFGTGDKTIVDSLTPVVVAGVSNASDVAAGRSHSCALIADGTARCWGVNTFGELGDGTRATSSLPIAPVTVAGLADATALAVGGNASCAVVASGGLMCWGNLAPGADYGLSPTAVAGITDASDVALGERYACVLHKSGKVSCWGDNSSSQLGQGGLNGAPMPAFSANPLEVPGLADAAAISAGYIHTCVLKAGGTIACWGRNDSGANGDGTTNVSLTPVEVAGVTGATGVAAGVFYGCALLSGGSVTCWGANNNGNLGDGTFSGSLTPVTVSGL